MLLRHRYGDETRLTYCCIKVSLLKSLVFIQEPDATQSEPEQPEGSEGVDEALISGEYNEYYSTVRSIGKGAFGFVKLAKKRDDQREVRHGVFHVMTSRRRWL